MTMTSAHLALRTVNARQQAVWETGDYAVIGSHPIE